MALYKSQPSTEELQTYKMLRYEYAMYVFLSSYFKHSTFSNDIVLGQLKVNYAEISKTKQEDLEETVIYTIDNFIIPKVKIKDMEDKDVKVTYHRRPNSKEHTLEFSGDGFKFLFWMETKYNKKINKEVLIIHFVEK